LNEEGVFRLAGSENKMKEIKAEIDTNIFMGSKDTHCVATLIKRWFKELPQPIFTQYREEILNCKFEHYDEAIYLIEQLQDIYKSLFYWLMTLLIDTGTRKEVNKMSPEALAIVSAPALVKIDDGDPIENLMLTQNAVLLVKAYLCNHLGTTTK